MNRAVLLTHLEATDYYVTRGEQCIGRLREVIDVLTRSGSDVTDAEGLLRQLEDVHGRHVSHREWLLNEIRNSTGITPPSPT